MISRTTTDAIGVLASGGLDSSILVGTCSPKGGACSRSIFAPASLAGGRTAGPAAVSGGHGDERLGRLVVLDLPLADLYDGHWSLTGRDTPDADSPDEAVFLPGRNALLLVKAAVWCQLHGIGELALAPLGTSPFEDASAAFFRDFQAAINRGGQRPVQAAAPVRRAEQAAGHGSSAADCRWS